MARLQRKDLAQEFSQVVQQEIKNHNDAVLASNSAIEEFRRQISDLKSEYKKLSISIGADNSTHANSLKNLEDALNNDISRLQRSINDSSEFQRSKLYALREAIESRESYFLTLQGFEEFKQKIDQWVANIERAFKQQKDAHCQEISKIAEKLQNSIEISRNSVEKSIKEEKEARGEQEKTFDIFAVNFSCLKEEVELLKRNCFVLEKHNENLYTQIERMKVNK